MKVTATELSFVKSLPRFIVKSWDNTEQVYRLVAWREREQAILLLDADRSPMILKAVLPQLNQKGWSYIRNPYPDADPVRMEAIRLVCPPCRGNAQEAAKINAPVEPSPFLSCSALSSGCGWEKTWVQYGDKVLFPMTDDAAALRAIGEQLMARKRAEYEARKRKLATLTLGELRCLQITRQINGLCALLPADADTLRRYVYEESFHLDFEISQPLSETAIGHGNARFPESRLCINNEYSDLVCSYLQTNWLLKHGLNIAAMEQNRLHFLEYIRKHAANVIENVPPAWDWRGQRKESTTQRPALQLTPEEELILCAQVRHALIFSDGSRVWLAPFKLRPPHANEKREFDFSPNTEVGRLEAVVPKLTAERQKLEAVPNKIVVESQRIEAATFQLDAKTKALSDAISPINRLYADVELAEIRKRANGQGIPDQITDWILNEFMGSDPPKLPTKGEVFNNCGPGTLIGKALKKANYGVAKQTFAGHLTKIRRLLEEKGWLATNIVTQSPLDAGRSRKRESNFQPDERLEDFNQPTPAESAEDRDEERRKAAVSGFEEEEAPDYDTD